MRSSSSRLTVEREGVLTLPAEVCEAAGLRPGDILAVEAREESLVLEIYRELLDGAGEHMDGRALRGFVARFLSRPLTALEPGGHVPIPAEVFPLAEGSELSLYVDSRGGSHLLQVFRAP
jgi:bifunctional DNA-binding transcriptional regulator/antitoxin component of YhaV-PrlF toxin-antitoxin module